MKESGTNGAEPVKLAKWSLAMIVAPDEHRAVELEKCLKSISAYPDEIIVTVTAKDDSTPGAKAVTSIAKAFGAKVSYFEWIEDFSAARNFSFAQCTNDIVMWLDSDDEVEFAQPFAKCIRNAFGKGEIDALHAEYLYDFDEVGRCTTVLNRERVVDRRCYEWREPIHELLCEKFQTRASRLPPQLGRVKHGHKRNDAAQKLSLTRNLRVIEHHYLPVEEGGLGEVCNERMLFYWANTLLGLGEPEKALAKFMEYIPRSGAPSEVQQALVHASECARMIGKFAEAKALAQQAIDRNPEAPTAYFMLAQAHNASGNYQLTEHYALLGLERANKFQQEIVSNPKVIFGGSAIIAAQAKYKQGKLSEIEPLLQVAEKYYGSDDASIVEMRKNIADWERKNSLLRAYNALKEEVEKKEGVAGVRKLAKLAPDEIAAHPAVAAFLPKHRPAGKRSIAFFCGGGMPGIWGPELLATGIGGSEEAVCYLSEQFVKAGWHVEVYAPCNRQTWQGVEWYPIEQYSGDADETALDVLVVWRAAYQILQMGSNAKRTYLWLHDTPNKQAWVQGIWDAYDGIFVLSKFHDGIYDFVPQDKKIITANGLPSERLVPMDKLANEPHRFVYASCPTRGLETVLLWWEQIRKAIPDAELEVYYGFHPTLMKQCEGKDPYSRAVANCVRRIDELRKQPGVNWHGFVGHEELHAGFAKCGLWLYPTEFPEISPVRGDTMIETLAGPRRIDSLVGEKDFKVYSCDAAGDLSISTVKGVFLTRKGARMVKLTMRPGVGRNAKKETMLYCTPDHEIMLRDGSYKPAGELKAGDRVKAFHNQKNGWQKGYAEVGVTGKQVVPAHRFVAEKCIRPIGLDEIVHHKNHDTADNRLENLEITTQSEHRAGHCAEMTAEARHDFAVMTQEKAKSRLGPAYGQMKREAANARWARRASNHIIMAVEDGGSADAFCMTVEPDHNFVANGIFVHNCITAMKMQAHGVVPVCSTIGALPETVTHGAKIQNIGTPEAQKLWCDTVIELAKNPPSDADRIDMALAARARFSWKAVCEQWTGIFSDHLAQPGRRDRFYARNRMDLIRS